MQVNDLPDRITSKFFVTDGHWLWTGARTSNGYGNVYWQGRVIGAHRLIKTLLHGAPEWEHEADHLCEHKHCVNPDHIEWVPRGGRINTVRAYARRFTDRTTCRNGHPWTDDNIYTRALPGGRVYQACRPCRNASAARSKKPTTNDLS